MGWRATKYEELWHIRAYHPDMNRADQREYISLESMQKKIKDLESRGWIIQFAGRYVLEEVYVECT